MRRVDDPGLVVQMLVLKLAELPRLRDIEAALAGAPPDERAAAARRPRVAPRGRREAGPRILSLVAGRAGARGAGRRPPPRPPGGDPIERFHEILDSRRRVTAAQVSLAESIGVDGRRAGAAVRDRPRGGQGSPRGARGEEAPRRRRAGGLRPLAADRAEDRARRPTATSARPRARCRGRRSRGSAPSSRAEADPMVRSAMELFRGELTEIKEEMSRSGASPSRRPRGRP